MRTAGFSCQVLSEMPEYRHANSHNMPTTSKLKMLLKQKDADEEKMDERIRMGWPWELILLLRRCVGNTIMGRSMAYTV
jgi:hypothetical protein